MTTIPEVWLRGPVEGIPALLQPVAHALLQAQEEVNAIMQDFPDEHLWDRPSGVASVGFHLQHLTGVLDRLFTYARGEMLTANQLASLSLEGTSDDFSGYSLWVNIFNQQVDMSINALRLIDENSLTEFRGVGRAQLPSTVLGLLFHAAEHTTRHVGQLLVTVKFLSV
jgi:uncharacterized damage-inducible protein DinB